jgi:hypothetical protein
MKEKPIESGPIQYMGGHKAYHPLLELVCSDKQLKRGVDLELELEPEPEIEIETQEAKLYATIAFWY